MNSSAPRHVAVIGAGIVGVAAALYLQRDGHRVTLIERQGPGEGASKGNASVIAAESCVPVATPGILARVPGMLLDPLGPLAIRWAYLPKLTPWLWQFVRASSPARVEAISIALRALLVRAIDSYLPLLDSAGVADMLKRTGWLGVYESEAKFAAAQADLALQRRRGVEFQLLEPAEIRQLEPSLAPIYRHAVYYPENAYITDNYRLVRVLAESLVRNGGALLKEEARDFVFGATGPTHVITDAGRHAVDAVVVAAGAWSKRLCARLGHRPLLDTERGYHVMFPEPGVMPRMPVYSGDHSFAVTPLSAGLRFAGTVELGGLAAPPNYARAEVLLERGRRMFPGLNETGRSQWMGFRPSMPDSLPVISGSTRHANAFFAFGHGHLGLTLGAVTGRTIAALVAGRDPGLDMRPYAIDRF
ncbi:MAG TPA: FAD-dependent oxidoreductase [Dongiaceae bacterium]|jgi:D-amino-acid dehydrogenase|nr:FAD-dependent oxidoreductase [Dongiaceae bacterium]